MKLSEIKPKAGAIKKERRIGRGPGSGSGTYAGRGMDGQRSRAGASIPIGFEGGQMPLTRSIPKRGFKNIFRKEYQIVNIGDIDKKTSGQTTVDPEILKAFGLIQYSNRPIKILGNGEISMPITIHAHKFSNTAKEKIEKANGKVELIVAAKKVTKRK